MAMGTKATTISIKTAQHWLKRMGWQYGKMPNGMYIDGHECEDIVEYHTWFLAKYKRLERQMRRFDKDGNIDKLPELQEGKQVLQEVTHDELTFYTDDWRKQGYWHPDERKKPVQKDEGSSIMVADFLTPEEGRLKDDIRYLGWIPLVGVLWCGWSQFHSAKPKSSSKQAKTAMDIGQVRMFSLKHAQQLKYFSESGLRNKVYFSMTMHRYTRNRHLVLFQQWKCPKVHNHGSLVLEYECVMGSFPMACLNRCIIPMTTWSSLASSKAWNRFYTNVAFSPLFDFWRLNVAPHSQSVHLDRPHAAADKFSIIKMISNNKSHFFKNCMKALATCACTTWNSTVSSISLNNIGVMQNLDIGRHPSLQMTKRWWRMCMSAWTPCHSNPSSATQFNLVDSWTATGKDWMDHRQLGHARNSIAIAPCCQMLSRRPGHAFEKNYNR